MDSRRLCSFDSSRVYRDIKAVTILAAIPIQEVCSRPHRVVGGPFASPAQWDSVAYSSLGDSSDARLEPKLCLVQLVPHREGSLGRPWRCGQSREDSVTDGNFASTGRDARRSRKL